MNEKFLKPYNSAETEDRIYERWEKSGFFNPDNLPDVDGKPRTEPFSIILPPPNVTGTLHLGHAYEDTVQDVMIRFARMNGKRALWLPGTDSAAIATQARVEKNIQKEEGKSRYDLGREELVRRVKAFAEESKETILSQLRKMGVSVDWSRYAYTLDEPRYKAVMTAFVRMHAADLIYRGDRIVNWDPKGQTTISDDEIVHVEEKGKFYYFKYGPFTIGTARPETKFGDKYVVMHPDDSRYAQYEHEQKIELEWINGPITATIIKDAAADMEFGTGVMTITPWHDLTDFNLAEKYQLDKEQVIDLRGKLLPIAQEFAGLKITEARQKIVDKLREKGLLVKEEEYTHNIATAERTGGIIEPQIMRQWFVGVDRKFVIPHSEIPGIASGDSITLKQMMRAVVENGGTTIEPEHFSKSYFHWIDNLHDWCISRQIWFGHRIPVWYRNEEVYCGIEAPQGDGWEQDPDVLDTWFSSALWTFSTLGWPEETADLKMYHPTTVIDPAYEILSLWVSRMILMSGFLLGQVPFKTALIHGIVRDKQGRKFSKSLGNGINPLDMIAKYGADALRMGIVSNTAVGNDMRFDEDRIKGYKLFANKIWNATRFVIATTEGIEETENPTYSDAQKEVLKVFETLTADVTLDLENFRFHLAAEKLYHYFWHTFADILIEESKAVLARGTNEEKKSTAALLRYLLQVQLTMLHPFMPFITEEIWSILPYQKATDLLMIAPWPSSTSRS